MAIDYQGFGHDEHVRTPPYYIASVGRALTLISIFEDRPQLTVSEAAVLLEVAPSTAHRILQMLVHHGYAVRGDRKMYLRGPRFDELAALAPLPPPGAHAPSALGTRLRNLRDELDATMHLVALEGNGARFLLGAARRDSGEVVTSRVGWLLPAHTVAGGKVLLANLSGPLVDGLFPAGVPLTRNGRIQSLSQLRRELRSVRQRGYARSMQEAHDDVVALAVAVPRNDTSTPPLALSAAWLAREFIQAGDEQSVPRLHEAAAELASAIAADRSALGSLFPAH